MINLDYLNNAVDNSILTVQADAEGNPLRDTLKQFTLLTNGQAVQDSNVKKFGVKVDTTNGNLILPAGIRSFYVSKRNTVFFTDTTEVSQDAPSFSK